MSEMPKAAESRVPIAVIGLGCWYPGARTPLELWENVLTRRIEFRKVPDCRLPNSDYCDPSGESIDKTYAQRCAVTDGFEFDWVGKRIPKSMFESTDLVHWLSLDVAEKAINDAGYTKDTLDKDGTGVIVGNTLTGDITRAETMRLRWPFVRRALRKSCEAHGMSDEAIAELEASMEASYKSVFATPTADSLAGGLANTIAGRVCNYFDLHGGGYIVDGACSSSLLAVCTAGRALSSGDLNVALVGGIDISIDPFELVGFSRAGALSRGEMNVYDKAAAGFIPGEGCGFAVLKRLDDAQRDGDKVYAVMKGWGISSDGKGGIMTPSSKGQATAIRRAYVGAGYTPADLDFVEGHGTGTRVGDQIELKGVFQAQTTSQAPTARRTGMTSLKSIIGHTKAAAGIGAFIKTTMAVNRRVLPPTGSCTEPNPVFQDTCHSLYPLMHGTVTDPSGKIRAGVSAMGFGGINSHVTLESGDTPSEKLLSTIDEYALLASNQTSEVFVCTASTYAQLSVEIANLKSTVADLSVGDLIDLSSELSQRATNGFPIRAVVIAGSVTDLLDRLDTLQSMISNEAPPSGAVAKSDEEVIWLSNQCSKSRVGFLFPGQGAQQLAMARKLVSRYSWAREMVAAADRVQAEAGLPTISQTVFVDVQRAIDKPTATAMRQALARTEVAQVAIVTASMIYARYLETMGVKPVVCGGHSLGELTALHQAGAFDFETLLQLVSLRGRAMAAPADQAGAMAALFCSRVKADELIAAVGGYAVLANVNSPKQVVVSGDEATILAIIHKATEHKLSTVRLNVSNAFHSKYVQSAADILGKQAPVPQRPQQLDIDLYSCIDGSRMSADVELREYLSRQVTSSVDFVSMVEAIQSQCDMLIEVGPNKVLSKLTKDILATSDVDCQSTASNPDVDCDMNKVLAKAFVSGVDVQWNRLFESRLARPFVPAEDRIFITNPCENPIAEIGEVEQLFQQPAAQATNGTETTRGISTESFRSSNAMTTPHSNSAPTTNARMNPMSHTPAGTMHEQPDDGIQQVIIDIVASRTGFPSESITPDLRLLNDLNMDSIKAGDVIASAARKLGALGPIDPASLADASIADVVVAVRAAKGGEATAAPMMDTASEEMTPAAMQTPVPMSAPMEIPKPVAQAPAPMMPPKAMSTPAPAAKPTPMATPRPMPTPTAQTPGSMSAPIPMANVNTTAASSMDDGVEDVIMDIVADRTGFPKDTLTSDLRLLDDLNMDSIKAGDVIASAARKLGALGPIDPASLADASIGDVVVAVRAAKNGEEVPMTETAPTMESGPAQMPAAAPVAAATMPAPKPMPAPMAQTPAPVSAPAPMAAPAARAMIDDGVESVIMDIIADRTGFPKQTLTSDLRLLDDLNMDSIKAGDVIASAARKLGALGPIDPASLADASIGDVVVAVRAAKNGEEAPMPTAPETQMNMAPAAAPVPSPTAMPVPMPVPMAAPMPAASMPKPMVTPKPMSAPKPISASAPMEAPSASMNTMSQDNMDWVDNFDMEIVAHRPKAMQQDISGRHFRVLYSPGDEAFMAKLADQFHERKASISFELFDQEGQISGDAYVAGAPLYVIAILPRKAGMGTSRQRVQRMIHRLRRAVGSTKFNANPVATGVAFVQFGNGRFGLEGMNDIETCTAAGFARALHLESQALEVRVIDLADKLSHILATDFITNEVAAAGNFRDCAYDALGRRYETRHRKVQPNDYSAQPLKLNGSDVIVVSGGARGITAALALAMAQKTGANFALVGSSPHPSQSTTASAAEITATLQRFAALPGKCEYFSCDLSDENAVRSMIASVESTIGPVTGVVHGAGRNNPKMASASTGEEVLSEVSPKVLGALNLIEALGDRSLNCFIGLTSIIGVTGIPGNSWYAFSNETLDLLLRQYKIQNPSALVRSISYSAWSEVGMGAQAHVETALRRMGVGLIPPNEGVSRFMYALEHDLSDPQMIVTGALGDIDTWRPSDSTVCKSNMLMTPMACDGSMAAMPCAMKAAKSNRYVGDIVSHQPGTSVVTRVKLSHENDPYLLDHIYEGTCLFPAVFGMEAMAQVASHLMPERPNLVRLQNIALSRPIIVGPEGDVDLELRAETMKHCPKSGETTISVAIRTERTQFQFEHFACEVVFGTPVVGENEPTQVGKPLAIDPERDLYTGILFQGESFRRWRDTYALEEGKMTFDVAHCTKVLNGEGMFGPAIASDATLTGDPYFHDVLLQSVQAIIPQKTGLPLSIEKIEFFAPSMADADAQSDRRLVTSMLHQIGDEVGKEHIAEVVAKDATGTIRERMTGYRVKVLAIKEEFPSACQLADLGKFDQALFEQQTMDAFKAADARAPIMQIKRMPELHGMNREQRRFREKPFLSDTVHKLKVQNSGNNAAPWIDWLPSGKPIVGDDPICQVSLSHDDDYCLCVANLVDAGCDIQPITERSREQWEALLGMHNAPLLNQLVEAGDCLNKAGTRIWAAVEAVQKSNDEASPVALQVAHVKDGTVRLASDQLNEGSVLITIPVSLHRNPARMVAVVAPRNAVADAAPKLLPRAHAPDMPSSMTAHAMMNGNGKMASRNGESRNGEMASSMDMNAEPSMRTDVAKPGEMRTIENVKAEIKWDGPRDQAVFEHRFVVTFKECAMRGKHIQHTNYLSWMGQMRENGLLYLVPDMVLKLSDGLSGMATNWTDVDIVGEAMMGDVIVARLWNVGMTDSSVTLGCDYSRVLPGNRLERLAYVEQATTWVRLDGRNDPTKEAFPTFLFDALKSMEPRSDREQVLPELPASLGRVKLEQKKLEAMPQHEPIVVWDEEFSTCLDDSNIVANIYYARYFHWQWRTSDLFFYDKVPNLMTGDVAMGNVRELVPLNSRIDNVRDAFPFDRIRTELAVVRSTDIAATLLFTHYRINEDGRQEKLAAGTQDVVWVRRTPNGTAVPEPLPLAVRQAFKGEALAAHGASDTNRLTNQ